MDWWSWDLNESESEHVELEANIKPRYSRANLKVWKPPDARCGIFLHQMGRRPNELNQHKGA